MPVTFDAVNSGSGAATPLTFAHTCAAGVTELTVGVAVDAAADGSVLASVTYNGVAMTSLLRWESGGSTEALGFLHVFTLANPPTGSAFNVVVTVTGTFDAVSAISMSFAGAATIGPAVHADSAASVVTSGSTGNVATVNASSIVAVYAVNGSGGTAFTAGTSRAVNISGGSGNAGGFCSAATIPGTGGNVAVTWTQTSDFYASIAVEVRGTGGQPQRMPQQLSRMAARRRKSAQRPQYNAQLPDVNIIAPVYAASVSLPAPNLPPTFPFITGLTGTGWTGYFSDQTGSPRLWVMTEDWGFPSNAGRYNSGAGWQADMTNYMAKRNAQKFTAMYTTPYGHTALGGAFDDGRTYDGLYPFLIDGVAGVITGGTATVTLNNTFWNRIDYLFTQAASNGITIYLNVGMNLTLSGIFASATGTQIQAVGQAIATRYASTQNLIWMIGDDFGPPSWESQMTSFLTGIRAAGDTRPISIENFQDSTSLRSLDGTTSMTWGIANAQYNWYYGFQPTYFGVEYCFTEAATFGVPQLPALAADTGWSADGTNDRLMRKQILWALSSGSRGCGFLLTTWNWPSTSETDLNTPPGSFVSTYLGTIRALYESLPAARTNLVPDTTSALVTAGRGTRWTYNAAPTQANLDADNYVTASVTADKSLAVIYMSHATTITINQANIAAGYTATWYDPASGASSAGTPGTTFNSTARGNNSAGDPDWLLVLQGPSATPDPIPHAPVVPVPPGWFPGADQVTAIPGGIPFAQIPAPTDQNAVASVTVTGTAAAAGAGAATAVVTQIAPATAAGAGSATAVATQIAGAAAAAAAAVTAVVTQIAPATAAGAGAVTDVVTQIATGAAAGAAAVADVVTLQAPATAAGAGSATAIVTQIAPATAVAAGAVTAVVTQGAGTLTTGAGAGSVTDVVTQIVIASAAAAGSVTAAGTVLGILPDPAAQWQPQPPGWFPGAQAVTVDPGGIPFYSEPQPAVTAPPPSVISGTASAAGAGAATAVVTQQATATAAGAGSVTAVVTQDAGTATTGAGAGAVTDVVTQAAIATAAGAGSVTDVATQQATGTAAGAGSVSDVVTQIAFASAAGAGSVIAVGTSSGGGTAAAAGAGAVTALATVQAPATAAGAGSVTAVVTQQAPGTAAGAGTVNASGAIAGAAGITGQGAATAKAVQGVIASPTGAGALSALAVLQATAALAGAAAVNATGLSTATVVKGYSTATSVGEQAGMSAKVTEQASSSAGVS